MLTMKLELQFHQPCLNTKSSTNLPLLIQLKTKSTRKPKNFKQNPNHSAQKPSLINKPIALKTTPKSKKISRIDDISVFEANTNEKSSRTLMIGAVSVGVVLFLMGFDYQNQALALGPEGPLMEEFWDNMRRYGLYALTVSTGVLYAVFQPIYELLKNPISAILVLTILGGGFYIVSQVVSAMTGVTEFAYDYSY